MLGNLDRAMPSWINKWLMINSLILYMDGSFCIFRPHSFPGGRLATFYYAYKYYIKADKFYADASDTFIWTQGLGNIVEATIGVLILLNVFRTARFTKLATMGVSVMTTYKTYLYVLYTFDIGKGGRDIEPWTSELMVYGMGSIWILVPQYVIWVLLKDFCDTTSKSSSSLSTSRTTRTSYDDVDSRLNTTRVTTQVRDLTYNSVQQSRTPAVQRIKSERKQEKVETPVQKKTTPSRRYNLRDRD